MYCMFQSCPLTLYPFTKDFNCKIAFFSTCCVFQVQVSGRTIGFAKENGLYYLEEMNVDKDNKLSLSYSSKFFFPPISPRYGLITSALDIQLLICLKACFHHFLERKMLLVHLCVHLGLHKGVPMTKKTLMRRMER